MFVRNDTTSERSCDSLLRTIFLVMRNTIAKHASTVYQPLNLTEGQQQFKLSHVSFTRHESALK